MMLLPGEGQVDWTPAPRQLLPTGRAALLWRRTALRTATTRSSSTASTAGRRCTAFAWCPAFAAGFGRASLGALGTALGRTLEGFDGDTCQLLNLLQELDQLIHVGPS
jgi:hypothetical protein